MTFQKTCKYLDRIEKTASRNEMTDIIVEAFHELKDDEIAIFCYLVIGRIAPMFVTSEFNMSEKSILKALESFCRFNGISLEVNQLRSELGDIGLVVESVLNKHDATTKRPQLSTIYQQLWDLVHIEGSGSVQRKADLYISMIDNMTPLEGKYITRVIVGKLRMGVSDRSILDAISVLHNGDKSMSEELSEYYGVLPDIGLVSYRYVKGRGKVMEAAPVIGIPVKSRLVSRVPNFEDLFERYDSHFYLQPKFDGLRCQVHKGVNQYSEELSDSVWIEQIQKIEDEKALSMFAASDGSGGVGSQVNLFSRNLEDLTDMFPEVVDEIKKIPVDSFILDCEVVGWDVDRARFNTFQETMKRKRIYNVEETRDSVPVRLYIFDVLAFGGKSTINEPFVDRLHLLDQLKIEESNNIVKLTETRKVSKMEEVQDFFNNSVEIGLEGLIAKDLDGTYEPGKRTYGWIKLKKSMSKKLVDTVDVVVMGYYKGSGRQSSLGIGALLVGIVGEDNSVESISKIGTGVTDDQWESIVSTLDPIAVAIRPAIYVVDKSLFPDVWVKPEIIATVEADEITKSQVHMAGRSQLGFGLALRFPRLVEFGRDKPFEEATNIGELTEMAGL